MQTDVADEMAAGLQAHVLVVLGTYLAHLERGSHLTVYLVLLLSDLNVLLLCRGQDLCQVQGLVQATGVQVAGGGGGYGVMLLHKLNKVSPT